MKLIKRLLSSERKSIDSQIGIKYSEYRVKFRKDAGYGIAYSKTLDQLVQSMRWLNVVDRYVMEGLHGIEWIQIQKSKCYDAN